MSSKIRAVAVLVLSLAATGRLPAQNKPSPDVIVFTDGEKLIGELKSATSKQVVFKSDMGFEVHVGWAKIAELHSNKRFAAIPKDLVLRRPADAGRVPQGTIALSNKNLEVTKTPAAPAETLPLDKVSSVIEEKEFEHAVGKQSFREGWSGFANAGLTLQSATVSSHAINTGFQLSRTEPSEGWMQPRNRTTIMWNSFYSYVTQAYVPPTKVSLFHAEAVQDRFLNPRWFIFAGTTFDHNFSQGLDLVQAYGGGIGAVVKKTEHSEFEVRGGIGFMNQTYSSDPSLNRKLVGSRFGQSFSYNFRNGISFFEQGGIRPAWNDSKYFFSGISLSLNIPVYHRLGLNLSAYDNYVNNPPPYFKRNVFQATFGASYSFK